MRATIDECVDIPQFLKCLKLTDQFNYSGTAWNQFKPSTIRACWDKGLRCEDETTAGPSKTTEDDDDEGTDFLGFTDVEVKPAQTKLASSLKKNPCLDDLFDDWSRVDEDCPVDCPSDEEEEVKAV